MGLHDREAIPTGGKHVEKPAAWVENSQCMSGERKVEKNLVGIRREDPKTRIH